MEIVMRIKGARITRVLFTLLLVMLSESGMAQYVKTEGKRIVDGQGEEIILRGIGLGGWMLQEGYMLRTWGAQHELEARIEELIGKEKKEEFYTKWLANHCTKPDIDSLAAWGFNSIRLPMHYKLFTPPIEEEPVQGEITWLDEGFLMVDDLLSWVKENDMYLILDLHAAPGGQGENADISDYDRSKPSLWESDLNKDKMVALWRKLAERYANEPNIAGYDLINETNWGFDNNHQTDINGCNQSTNAPLWELQERCINAIREVDTNHMIIIEGNCWGNNYNGLPEQLWDDNITISYHKYWNSNDQSSLDPLLATQNKWNVPLWLGETGENSNQWFTDAIELLENNNIGWSWWPQKKMGGNNVQEIEINDGYQDILDFWSGNAEKPTEAEAYASLMQIAENLKEENNTYHFDVVDAMTRQPYDKSAQPFKTIQILGGLTNRIFFTDYDFGGQGVAYADTEYANETGQPGGSAWNIGGRYRNDGVDIEECQDDVTNGFNVGWTNQFEWMQYTINVEEAGGYQLSIRYAGPDQGVIRVLVNDDDMSGNVPLEATGGYQVWNTESISDVILETGKNTVKFYIEKGGINLNFFEFTKTKNLEELNFKAVSAFTSESGDAILLSVNKALDNSSISKEGFQIVLDGQSINITSINISEESNKVIVLTFAEEILYESDIKISYNGSQVKSVTGQILESFTDLTVGSGLPIHYYIPGKIFADDFFYMDGMVVLKNEKDAGSDFHLGYTDAGDFAEYYITVPEEGLYNLQVRAANNFGSDGKIEFEQVDFEGNVLNNVEVSLLPTGGWENWRTSASVEWNLESGRSILRMKVKKAGINLTWYIMSKALTVTGIEEKKSKVDIYPNPSNGLIYVVLPRDFKSADSVRILNLNGTTVLKAMDNNKNLSSCSLNVSGLSEGIYILEVTTGETVLQSKVIIKN